MSKWIWKFGEFENYQSLLVHSKRQNYGYIEPITWKQYGCDPVVIFQKRTVTSKGEIQVQARGTYSTTVIHFREKGKVCPQSYWGQETIPIEAGDNLIMIRVQNIETFPSLYVTGVVESDESWMADNLNGEITPVGTNEFFKEKENTPEVFPFVYSQVTPVKEEKINKGILYDFGKEMYGPVEIKGLTERDVTVQYGESREEALDSEWSVIHFHEENVKGRLKYPSYAFRYIWISDEDAEITAKYEYLPLQYKGAFQCDDSVINQVWNVAAYTFHLNSREFFLDGIKRDHWVWSADAYQCLFVNRYLFFDKDIEQRTLIALGGKQPFQKHINNIVDYTFFWIIGLYEHYMTFGDVKFLRQIEPQLDAVMKFCLSREDEDGFIRGKEGDWVFIDWAEMDKTGALCGEQILWARALLCYGKLKEILVKDRRRNDSDGTETGKEEEQNSAKFFQNKAIKLQKQIVAKFFDNEKQVFIDSFESGKRNVTRHSNILAYLFLPCTEVMKNSIYENVILNNQVKQITTPYFKFYENQLHCQHGNKNLLEESIRTYYGGMLKHGATSLYEEYNPDMSGTEHYAMYGRPYEKSLCHAWSASPIYLLGAYRMGVRNTGTAYDSFEVVPQLGDLKWFEGKVSVPDGYVTVKADEEKITVVSDIPGDILKIAGKIYELEAGKEMSVKR